MEEPDSLTYFLRRRSDRVYITRSFEDEGQRKRLMYKVVEPAEDHEFVTIKGEVLLRVSPGGRQQLRALFYEVGRGIQHLAFQKFSVETGKALRTCFSFGPEEIKVLKQFLASVEELELNSDDGLTIPWNLRQQRRLSRHEKQQIISENPDLVEEAMRHSLTKADIVAIAYRREQLEVFRGLLQSPDYFSAKQAEWNRRRAEDVWQHFFEENKWIFGHSLSYLCLASLDDKKLEQVVAGYNFSSSGKRVDALMKTRGLVSSLCFIEIKTHTTPLLSQQAEPYRGECWPISPQVAGSHVQILTTVHKAVKSIETRIRMTDRKGDPTSEEVFVYNPRAYLVIGSHLEFQTEYGINEEKFRSFELWRQSLQGVEVITFDELFERAASMVNSPEDRCIDLAA